MTSASDERLLPAAGPALELGFAAQGGGTVGVFLFPDQADRSTRGGVLGGLAAVVLLEAASGVGGDAGVERAVGAAEEVAEVHWACLRRCPGRLPQVPVGKCSLRTCFEVLLKSHCLRLFWERKVGG